MTPTFSFFNFFNPIWNVILIATSSYLIYRWDEEGRADDVRWYLIIGITLLVISLFGWFIIPLIFGGKQGEPLPAEAKRLNSDGNKLFVEKYLVDGAEKPTLIFTNGWATTAQVWHYFRKDLSQDYNLIFWDEPGLGKSDAPQSGDHSLPKYATDLKNIVSQVPGNKVILVGHSIGGMIIQEMYKMYPDFVKTKVVGLVLVNTTYTNPVETAILSRFLLAIQNIILKPVMYLQIYTWPIWQLNNYLSFLNGGIHLASFVSGFSGNQTKQELNLTAKLLTVARIDVVNKGNLGMMKFDNQSMLKNITTPTLILAGSNDILTKPEASMYMNSQIPGSQLNIISGANHMGLLEYNQQYLNALRNWLKVVV